MLRGEVYPLSVAAERTQQALSVVEVARGIGAEAVAHGSTGAGQRPGPLRRRAPRARARARDRHARSATPGIKREQAIAYLEARGLPVPAKAGAY